MRRSVLLALLFSAMSTGAVAQTSEPPAWVEQCRVATPAIERVIVERNIDLGQLPDVQHLLDEARAACAAGDDVKAAAHIDYVSRRLFAQ